MCSARKNPYPPHGRSSKIPSRRRVLKAEILEAKYEAKLEFLGGMGLQNKKPTMGGGMDIFQNYTIYLVTLHKLNMFSNAQYILTN